MSVDSPFLIFKIECPICKTLNEFESVRVGAYVEEGRDSDFCPRNIKWRFARYQGCNPLLFFTATCNNCAYTRELTPAYKDWKDDTNFKTYRLKTVKAKHLDQLSTADSVIRRLSEAIDPARYPNETAIIKLLLAVYDEQLADHYSRLDVGRFYLRIAWVFRDMEQGENPNQLLLTGLAQELEDSYRSLAESLAAVHQQAYAFGSTVHAHAGMEQLSADQKGAILASAALYDGYLNGLRSHIDQAEGSAGQIRAVLDEYKRQQLGGSEGGSRSFGTYSSFAAFLQSVRSLWNGVVFTEQQAIEKAVLHYKEAFANGRDIAPGNQQIQAGYLIAELSRRIGDFDEAKQYFTSTIKSGQEFIHQNRNDQSRIALAKKILELAIEQGRANLQAARPR